MPPPSPNAFAVVPFAPSAADDVVGRRRGCVDRRALPHLHPALARSVEEECVEPPPLRHADHRRARAAHDGVAEPEPQLDEVDLLLDDRRRVDRAVRERARS